VPRSASTPAPILRSFISSSDTTRQQPCREPAASHGPILLNEEADALTAHRPNEPRARFAGLRLQLLVEQIAEFEREIAQALDTDPDGEIFRSFVRSPGLGPLCRDTAGRDR
jgi:hypothetical protein